ncbi:hypothetical protein ACQY0O_000871 [Thecaphora frezii]
MSEPGDPVAAPGNDIEAWDEGDFELNDKDIVFHPSPTTQLQHRRDGPSHADEPGGADAASWDEGLGDDANPTIIHPPAQDGSRTEDDDVDDHTDTIKLSDAAGSALKHMIEAQRSGQCPSLIAQLGGGGISTEHAHEGDDWDADLEIPDSLPFDAQGLLRRRGSFTSDLEGDGPSASASTSTSTSYKSMLGLSTDFTDPETSPRRAPQKQASGASASASTASSTASSLLSPAYQFRGRGDAASLGQEADSETDIEHDFDLDPDLDKLSLSPAVSRQRSHPALDQEKLLWGEDPGARSPSPEPSRSRSRSSDGGIDPPQDQVGHHDEDPASSAQFTAESDADDEHEDLLDGLVLEGSVFEMEATSGDAKPIKQMTEKLEALLNVKRAGELPEAGSSQQRSDAPIESEADLAGGLVITDDLDLSPSRLSSNKLTYRTRSRGPSQASFGVSRGMPTRQPSLPASSSSSTLSHLWSHHWGSRMPPLNNLSVPSRSEIFSPHARQRTLSQISASTSAGYPSEMSTSGSRPRIPRSKGLQYKRSASDLQQKAADSPAPQHRARTKGLTRKRSLPSLADRFRQQGRPTSSSGSASGSTLTAPRPPSSFSSRITASTAASRARAAETAADILARMAKDGSTPPPSSPNGSVSAASRALSVATRGLTRGRPNTVNDCSPSHHRARSPHPLRQERVSSPLVQGPASAHFLRRTAAYGDGAELDSIEDLPSTSTSAARARPERPARTGSNDSASRGPRTRTKQQSKPGLIKPLGASSVSQKVVKGMRWNPRALRWEGNESALRDFDSVVQISTRPALISQLTGSSTSSALASLSGYSSPVLQDSGSLITNIACGVKMVGDMIFDPLQMKWIHRNCEEDAEVFAQFEEEGFSSEAGSNQLLDPHAASLRGIGSDCGSEARSEAARGNPSWDVESTIRARKMRSGNFGGRLDERWSPASSEASKLPRSPGPRGLKLVSKVEAAVVHAIKTGTNPELDNVDEGLWRACLEAETRHRSEVQTFLPRSVQMHTHGSSASLEYAPSLEEIEKPRPHLYHLQKIARGLSKGKGSGAPASTASGASS